MKTVHIRSLIDELRNGPPALVDALHAICDELDMGSAATDGHPLLTQIRCGVTDPREDDYHPGRLLLDLGWTYHGPDPMGCEWSLDRFDEAATKVTLPQALGEALRTLLADIAELPNASEQR